MKKAILLFSILLLNLAVWSQSVMLDSTYGVRSDTTTYGTALSYRGCMESLTMKVYHPLNQATDRPIVVMVHGGAWVGGTYDDYSMQRLGTQLAARGYMAASIKYRLGYHIQPVINAGFGCLLFNSLLGTPLDACQYPADTAEVYRALYRAMQDTKTAIRYLKANSVQDSTNKNAVYLIGESAGAFTVLQAAFMDQAAEKPSLTGVIADAPMPVSFQCNWNNPCGTLDRTRPDLGDVRGLGNLQESDDVRGVISLMGAMPTTAITQQNAFFPRLYFYHQSCDPVVPYQSGKVYKGVNSCMNDWAPGCFNCPSILNVPTVKGGRYLYDTLSASAYPALVQGDFLERGVPISQYYGCLPDLNTCGGLPVCPNCFNSGLYDCHSTFLPQTRIDSVSKFLFESVVAVPKASFNLGFGLSPNPTEGQVKLAMPQGFNGQVKVLDMQGRALQTQDVAGTSVALSVAALPAGVYFVRFEGQNEVVATLKLVRE